MKKQEKLQKYTVARPWQEKWKNEEIEEIDVEGTWVVQTKVKKLYQKY